MSSMILENSVLFESSSSPSSYLQGFEFDSINNESVVNDSTRTYGDDIEFHRPALFLLLVCFCIATVFGNCLVIVAVARERYLHSVTNYFITSLGVADLLVGLIVMPFQAIYDVLDKKWIFGEEFCDLWHSFDVLASTSSILHLSVISLDRYWAITDPFSYPSRMTNRKACILIALVWVCSSIISFPAIFWWRAVRPSSGQLQPKWNCEFTDNLPYLLFSSIVSFYGPLIVMVFTYYSIYKAAMETESALRTGTKLCTDGDMELTLRIHRSGGNSHPTSHDTRLYDPAIPHPNDNGSSSTLPRNNSVRVVPKHLKNFSISRKLAKFAKEKKAAKTLGIVMGVFIICWLPFFVTNLLSGICGKVCLSNAQLVMEIALWAGWINSGMNPVIYACWSRDFRSNNRDVNEGSEYEFPSQKSPGLGLGLISNNERHTSRGGKIPIPSMTMTAAVTTAIITPSSPPVGSYSSSVSHDLFNS